MSWGGSSPGLSRAKMIELIGGLLLVIIGAVGASIAASIGSYILQTLNKTGFTIPASYNYLTPIGSLPSTVILILMIVILVVGVAFIIKVLLDVFGGGFGAT